MALLEVKDLEITFDKNSNWENAEFHIDVTTKDESITFTFKGKVTKVEYMLLDESYNGMPFYITVLVLTINSKKYVITDDNGEIFFHLNENNNYHCSKFTTCYNN